ncbi:cysteine hydrolase family protein [Leptothrix discophora]|uniref:Isochorismatase family protein n=1 Tax=Leptothrix discophora TaxID=89 RepID=A0ABT9G645_LEPDI|nr:isochorismatase family protein [Leptothrix discophora]MDP4301957.1 isochorismatase family protein [Leptothrix discophora]
MTTALLLIDVQASFPARPYWDERELPAFLSACNTLIDGCVARGVPIVQVFHSDGPDQPDNPFAPCSGLLRPLAGLRDYPPALTLHKHRHSALVGTGLSIWLHQQGIRRLIVAGIRTEQCCETTARHASDEGWAVDYVTDATLTFDMRTPDGALLSAADIRERTATVLAGRFATICSVAQALDRARREPAEAHA